MYKCSKCKLPVLVVPNEKPVKICKCENATIIADMSASAKGIGGVQIGKKK